MFWAWLLVLGVAIYFNVGWLFYIGITLYAVAGWQFNNFSVDGERVPMPIVYAVNLSLALILVGLCWFIWEKVS